MSYINDALRKAQEDKKSPYAAYEPIVSALGKKNNGKRKWLILTGLSIFALWAAGVLVFFSWPKAENTPAAEPLQISEVADVQPAIQAEQQAFKEVATVSENKAEIKTQAKAERPKSATEFIDSKILFEQALKNQKEGNLPEAKKLYKQVIKMEPRNIRALNNLGVVYMDLNVHKWAIIRLNDALDIKPDYADAHYNLACIYAQKNDLSQSLFYLKNAVAYNPEARKWAQNDNDFKVFAELPEFKKLLEKR